MFSVDCSKLEGPSKKRRKSCIAYFTKQETFIPYGDETPKHESKKTKEEKAEEAYHKFMEFIKLPKNALEKIEKPNYARPTFDTATSAFHTEKHNDVPDAGYNALEKLLNMPSVE